MGKGRIWWMSLGRNGVNARGTLDRCCLIYMDNVSLSKGGWEG